MADGSNQHGVCSEMLMQNRINELIKTSGTCLTLASLDSELDQIPEDLLAQFSVENLERIEEVIVDFNDFLSLPQSISLLKGLLKLSAEGNEIRSLPSGIGDLIFLEELRMNENKLRELPTTFSRLRSLRVVSLVANELRCLTAETVEGLEHLEELYLDENQLSTLPENFGVLKSLHVLELSENKVTFLPESFGELVELQVLNLSRNNLSDLPNSFGKLSHLRDVDLSDNNISTLPEIFLSSSVIENLYLDNNIIGILPKWCSTLSHIVNLSIADNKLQGCPFAESFPITSQATLKKLEAGGNAISSLPASLGELRCLKELHLGSTISELERSNFQNGNWIRQLPESFGRLKSISKLHLDENQLTALPDSFGSLLTLTWLDLGQNLLSYLPETFCSLESLEYCQLSKNKLLCLPLDFGKLKKLADLRLDQNLLEDLPESCSNLQSLHTLDLFNNKMKQVPSWLYKLSSLKRLDLDENNLNLKLKDIPHLASKGSEYAIRDPKLKDNWRGKTRADKIKAEVVVISDDNASEGEEGEEESPVQPAVYSENVLFVAMRRGLSIWKTHTGPDERMVQPIQDINHKELTFNVFEDYLFDDSIAKNSGFYVKLSQKASNNGDGAAQPEEDWDKEINESWKTFNIDEGLFHSVGVQVSGVGIEKRNEFLSLLSSYPPASQAYSPTATYNSLVVCGSNKNYDDNKSLCNASFTDPVIQQAVLIQGQFDDAD